MSDKICETNTMGTSWSGEEVKWRGTLVRDDGVVTVGICAMDKKANSKYMREILQRMNRDMFEFITFGNDCIFQRDVSEWPICDVLIAFHSSGFPLEKVQEYVDLQHPYSINDLCIQDQMKDRRKVYARLKSIGVPVPENVCMNRDSPDSEHQTLVEADDNIIVNGVTITKPFVEKPVDADDHNIYIYYPMSAGGGSKRIFRKKHDRSSEFYPDVNEVRREGSYIYETFMETQGADVKVYTIGPNYGHAEARKSPSLDGVVNRDADGKEVRYPVILTPMEKGIASRVTLAFGQCVCGFDILRVQGNSFVCDVNGWSFVKNSRKYTEDCAMLLMEFFEAGVKPRKMKVFTTVAPLFRSANNVLMGPYSAAGSPNSITDMKSNLDAGPSSCSSSTTSHQSSPFLPRKASSRLPKTPEELRCIIAIIRHGDRTPKQKMKMVVTYPHILAYYERHSSKPGSDLKVKGKSELKEFLSVALELMSDGTIVDANVPMIMHKLQQVQHVLERWEISGINRKLQLKPLEFEDDPDVPGVKRVSKLLLVLKWGGELTKLGEKQAMALGHSFRESLYPGVGSEVSGGGLLRLHSTFRHDLKIKTSDEGRVMKTAAAFAKGFLELEGELPPILVSLVRKEKVMLDQSGNKNIKKNMDQCKAYIKKVMDINHALSEEEIRKLVPSQQQTVVDALKAISNPKSCMEELLKLMSGIVQQLERLVLSGKNSYQCTSGTNTRSSVIISNMDNHPNNNSVSPKRLPLRSSSVENANNDNKDADEIRGESLRFDADEICGGSLRFDAACQEKPARGETLLLMLDRWRKLHKDFYNEKKGGFNITKIPDVHDAARYDCLHNAHLSLMHLPEMYEISKTLADCVVPQEYGIDVDEKLLIGSKICSAFMEKIKYDLIIARSDDELDMQYKLDESHAEDLTIKSVGRQVRTRLYFTSESHLQALLNVLRYPIDDQHQIVSHGGKEVCDRTQELCYLTSFVLRLYEDPNKYYDDQSRFRVEVMFSPGVVKHPLQSKDRLKSRPLTALNKNLSCAQVEEMLDAAIARAARESLNEAAHMHKLRINTFGLDKAQQAQSEARAKESMFPGRGKLDSVGHRDERPSSDWANTGYGLRPTLNSVQSEDSHNNHRELFKQQQRKFPEDDLWEVKKKKNGIGSGVSITFITFVTIVGACITFISLRRRRT